MYNKIIIYLIFLTIPIIYILLVYHPKDCNNKIEKMKISLSSLNKKFDESLLKHQILRDENDDFFSFNDNLSNGSKKIFNNGAYFSMKNIKKIKNLKTNDNFLITFYHNDDYLFEINQIDSNFLIIDNKIKIENNDGLFTIDFNINKFLINNFEKKNLNMKLSNKILTKNIDELYIEFF